MDNREIIARIWTSPGESHMIPALAETVKIKTRQWAFSLVTDTHGILTSVQRFPSEIAAHFGSHTKVIEFKTSDAQS